MREVSAEPSPLPIAPLQREAPRSSDRLATRGSDRLVALDDELDAQQRELIAALDEELDEAHREYEEEKKALLQLDAQTIDPIHSEPQMIDPDPQLIDPDPPTIDPEPQLIDPDPQLIDPDQLIDPEPQLIDPDPPTIDPDPPMPPTEPEEQRAEPSDERELLQASCRSSPQSWRSEDFALTSFSFSVQDADGADGAKASQKKKKSKGTSFGASRGEPAVSHPRGERGQRRQQRGQRRQRRRAQGEPSLGRVGAGGESPRRGGCERRHAGLERSPHAAVRSRAACERYDWRLGEAEGRSAWEPTCGLTHPAEPKCPIALRADPLVASSTQLSIYATCV